MSSESINPLIDLISLTDFKGFQGENKISMRPITLLVGRNSAGKSSVMKSILAMAQSSIKPPDQNIGLNLVGKLANCGTFFETLNAECDNEKFSIGIGVSATALNYREDEEEDYHNQYFLGDSYHLNYTFSKHPEGPLTAVFNSITAKIGDKKIFSAGSPYVNQDPYELFIFQPRAKALTRFKPSQTTLFQNTDELYGESPIPEFSFDHLTDITIAEGPVIQMSQSFDFGVLGKAGIWHSHPNNSAMIRPLVGWSDRASQHISWVLNRLIYLGPLREEPSREAKAFSSAGNRIGIKGEKLPLLLHKRRDDEKFMNKLNDYVERLDIAKALYTEESYFLGADEEYRKTGYIRVIAEDGFGRKRPLSDMGFGVSQVAPVVCELALRKRRLILVEQPEVHLHPKAQTELGDLLIDSIIENKNQILVETHSANLIERLRRRIREGKISYNDVNIIYLKSSKKGSKVISIGFEENGNFDKAWPEDTFFGEREMESLGW